MKRFLQKLAGSVIQPRLNLHPFAESMYPPPVRASSERLAQASEIIVGTPGPQSSPSQQVTPIQAQLFTPVRSPHREASLPSGTPPFLAREENASAHEQNIYRPLLPPRESKNSQAGLVAPLHREADATPANISDSHGRGRQDEERDPGVSSTRITNTGHVVQEELRPARQVMPPQPQFDPQTWSALRKPAPAAAPIIPRPQQETRGPDDIHINIGRIEVIAVQPSPPRPVPAPARKGLSLDEYLGRRNGRVG